MSETIYLVPKNGVQVFDPDARDFLPPEGRKLTKTTYWRRRLKDGDVTHGTPPKPASKTQTTKKGV